MIFAKRNIESQTATLSAKDMAGLVAQMVTAAVDSRVAALVDERLAEALPKIQADMADAARRSLPSWIRRLPLYNSKELAVTWVDRHGAGLTATLNDEEIPTFYRDGSPVVFPEAVTRQMVEGILAQISEHPFDSAWRSGRGVAQAAIGSGTAANFKRSVAEVLIERRRGEG